LGAVVFIAPLSIDCRALSPTAVGNDHHHGQVAAGSRLMQAREK